MTQLADAPASTSSIASWFDYLTAPSPGGPDLPTAERFVLAAVLADETIVKIDDGARWYPAAECYRSAGAKVELNEAMRGEDGVYTTDSGLYRILTPAQYADIKSVEAARAEAAASAAVSSPRATRASTPTEVKDAVARLAISSAPTGCGAHAKMVTVVAVGPQHIRAALKRATPTMEQARKANNEIVIVVLGVANEAEAEEALYIGGRVVMLAGASEMAAVLPDGKTGPMRAYLRQSKLLDCVAGSAAGTSGDGGGGAWVLPTHPVPLDALPSTFNEPRGARSLVEWKDALNKQWSEWFERFERQTLQTESDRALLAAYTNFPRAPLRHPPLPGLPDTAIAIVGLSPAPPFGVVDHTIRWSVAKGAGGAHRTWPEPAAFWASTGGGAASVYWAVATWCGSACAALRAAEPNPALDLHTDEDELQAEVETTLVSLLMYEPVPFRNSFDALRGVLGPVVFAGREGSQPMRAAWWTVPGRAGGVLMLLPEAYVQMAMEGYPRETPTASGRGFVCAQGYLAVADVDAVPMRFDGVDPGEYDAELQAFGNRLWISNGATATEALEAVLSLDGAPKVAAPLLTYRMQRDADQAEAGADLAAGCRVPTASARTIFYTSTTSDDTLSGLRVRWTRRNEPPHLPTLDVDTVGGGAQLPYEYFA